MADGHHDFAALAGATAQDLGTQIQSAGRIALGAGRNIGMQAATLAAQGDLSVAAGANLLIVPGSAQQSSMLVSRKRSNGVLSHSSQTVTANSAGESAMASRLSGANVSLSAQNGDLDLIGSDISAAQEADLRAGRDVNIYAVTDSTAASLSLQSTKADFVAVAGTSVGVLDYGHSKEQDAIVSTQTSRPSRISAGDALNIQSGATLNVNASALSAGQQLNLTGAQINIVSGLDQTDRYYGASSDIGRIGSNALGAAYDVSSDQGDQSNHFQSTGLAPATLRAPHIRLNATDADLTLRAAQLSASQDVQLNAPKGALNIDLVSTGASASQNVTRSSLFYQYSGASEASAQQAHTTQIDTPHLDIHTSTINAQTGIPSLQSQDSHGNVSTQQLQTLQQALQQARTTGGPSWREQIQSDPKLAGVQINWQGVPESTHYWAQSQSGLTQAGAAAVVIAATVLTMGTTTELAAGAGSAISSATDGVISAGVAGAAVQAGLAAVASQAAVGLINEHGNVGAVLKDLSSSQSVKQVLAAMVTAGTLQGLNLNPIGPQTARQGVPATLAANLQAGLARAVVNTAITGGSMEENLRTALKGALLDTVASSVSAEIGQLADSRVIDPFTQELAHAIAGCAVGTARADNAGGCGAGALGAVVGELTGEAFANSIQSPAQVSQLSGMFAALAVATVGGSAEQIQIAQQEGAIAALNNSCGSGDPDQCKKTLAAWGAGAGFVLSGGLSLVGDVYTLGGNVLATPAEIGAGTAAGTAGGYALGNFLDQSWDSLSNAWDRTVSMAGFGGSAGPSLITATPIAYGVSKLMGEPAGPSLTTTPAEQQIGPSTTTTPGAVLAPDTTPGYAGGDLPDYSLPGYTQIDPAPGSNIISTPMPANNPTGGPVMMNQSGANEAGSAGNNNLVSQVDEAIRNITNGMANTTGKGSEYLNWTGSGGIDAARQAFDLLPAVPGSAKTYPNGAQVITLTDGSTATLYPTAKSTGAPSIQISRPNGAGDEIKIRF
jgi:filamentous hemagglutinin